MAPAMTKDDLSALIKSVAGSEIADAIKEFKREQAEREAVEAKAFSRWREMQGSASFNTAQTSDAVREHNANLAARVIRALASSKGDPDRAAHYATKHWQDHEPVVKALAAGEAQSGGFLLPTDLSTSVIELLRPQAVVRRMGPQSIPMPVGSMRIPKVIEGSAASYIGENQPAGVTQPKFGQVVLSFKKLAAMVPVSNDMLRYAISSADATVRNDLVRAMAQREDLAFIRGQGTDATPQGLRYWAPAANVMAVTGTDTLADIATNFGRAILRLKNANVPMTRPGWLISNRTEFRLATIQNANGFFAFRQEVVTGRFWNIPFATSTQIPDNLGVGGNESEIYLADFDDVAIGEALALRVDASTEAAYNDGGTVRSAFQNDQTVVRAIAEHDLAVRRDVAVVVLTGVLYGA